MNRELLQQVVYITQPAIRKLKTEVREALGKSMWQYPVPDTDVTLIAKLERFRHHFGNSYGALRSLITRKNAWEIGNAIIWTLLTTGPDTEAEYYGYAEASIALGWDPKSSNLRTYMQRAEEKGWPDGMLPKPAFKLQATWVWKAEDIKQFAESRKGSRK